MTEGRCLRGSVRVTGVTVDLRVLEGDESPVLWRCRRVEDESLRPQVCPSRSGGRYGKSTRHSLSFNETSSLPETRLEGWGSGLVGGCYYFSRLPLTWNEVSSVTRYTDVI